MAANSLGTKGAVIQSFKYLYAAMIVALAAPASLYAQDVVRAQPANVLMQAVPIEPRASTADGQLLEVARAADVNLFVDATNLPDKATQATALQIAPQDQTLWSLIIGVTRSQRLAWDFVNQDRILLSGMEPDLKGLRQKLLAAPEIKTIEPQIDEATFSTRMLDYLSRAQGWKGDATIWSKTIRIADLPTELKREVVARGQRAILSGANLDAMLSAIKDETWSRSRLRLLSPQEAEVGEPGLVLEMPTSLGFVRFKLILPQPQPQERQ